ncbi:MAG: phosphoribulokinase [Methanomicrobiaceae archaeon]|nr:phosphoribulokinase [Methanomicrobiaceae archaeon]
MKQRDFKDVIAKSPYIFTIGVAGDSGSGKTTFTQVLRTIFGSDLISTITLDDYHRYDRRERSERKITPLAPEANRFDLLEEHLAALKEGRTIEKPVYNHTTGMFDPPEPFSPTKILILEGLHPFFTPRLRELLDFKLYVDPDPDVKRTWKIRRDVEKRGYRRDDVIEEMAEREPDYQKYVAPQCAYADAVIKISYSKYGKSVSEEKNIYQVTLCQSKLDRTIREVELSIDLLSLLSLSERAFMLEYWIDEINGRPMGALSFDGELNYDVIRKLEKRVESQTHIHPISIYENHPYVTAGETVQLILSWRIINRRIFIETAEPAAVEQ